MEEGHQLSLGARPWLRVQDLKTPGRKLLEGLVDVFHFEAEMVQSRAAAIERFLQRRFTAENRQQLYSGARLLHELHFHSALGHADMQATCHAKGRLVQSRGLLQLEHGHADVVKPKQFYSTTCSRYSPQAPRNRLEISPTVAYACTHSRMVSTSGPSVAAARLNSASEASTC